MSVKEIGGGGGGEVGRWRDLETGSERGKGRASDRIGGSMGHVRRGERG